MKKTLSTITLVLIMAMTTSCSTLPDNSASNTEVKVEQSQHHKTSKTTKNAYKAKKVKKKKSKKVKTNTTIQEVKHIDANPETVVAAAAEETSAQEAKTTTEPAKEENIDTHQ